VRDGFRHHPQQPLSRFLHSSRSHPWERRGALRVSGIDDTTTTPPRTHVSQWVSWSGDLHENNPRQSRPPQSSVKVTPTRSLSCHSDSLNDSAHTAANRTSTTRSHTRVCTPAGKLLAFQETLSSGSLRPAVVVAAPEHSSHSGRTTAWEKSYALLRTQRLCHAMP
jgi:hypothetical protein